MKGAQRLSRGLRLRSRSLRRPTSPPLPFQRACFGATRVSGLCSFRLWSSAWSGLRELGEVAALQPFINVWDGGRDGQRRQTGEALTTKSYSKLPRCSRSMLAIRHARRCTQVPVSLESRPCKAPASSATSVRRSFRAGVEDRDIPQTAIGAPPVAITCSVCPRDSARRDLQESRADARGPRHPDGMPVDT